MRALLLVASCVPAIAGYDDPADTWVTKTIAGVLCTESKVSAKCASELLAEDLPFPFHKGKCADAGYTKFSWEKEFPTKQPDCGKSIKWTYYIKPEQAQDTVGHGQLLAPEQAQDTIGHGASGYKCPGSGSAIHAWSEVTAVADASCADVMAEMEARANAQGGWTDPHNGGIYSVLSSTSNELRTQRSTNPKKSVGHQVYTDKQIFQLTDSGSQCTISACSESQGFSVGDFSTNYCDMRNLYCGVADGCSTVLHNFASKETGTAKSLGASIDFSKCIVKADESQDAVVESKQQCKGMNAHCGGNLDCCSGRCAASHLCRPDEDDAGIVV